MSKTTKTFNQINLNFISQKELLLQSLLFVSEALDAASKPENQKLMELWNGFKQSLKEEEKSCLNYYTSFAFIQLITVFEIHLFEYCKLVLKMHPKKIGAKNVSILDVIESSSIEHATEKAIDGYMHEISYQKPLEYFDTITSILSIEKSVLVSHWNQLIEAKARRDLGVHGDWRANDIYFRKLKEAKLPIEPHSAGKNLVPNIEYFLKTYEELNVILKAILENCEKKFDKSNRISSKSEQSSDESQ